MKKVEQRKKAKEAEKE